jgi:hypothetical protein
MMQKHVPERDCAYGVTHFRRQICNVISDVSLSRPDRKASAYLILKTMYVKSNTLLALFAFSLKLFRSILRRPAGISLNFS